MRKVIIEKIIPAAANAFANLENSIRTTLPEKIKSIKQEL